MDDEKKIVIELDYAQAKALYDLIKAMQAFVHGDLYELRRELKAKL